MRLSGETGSRTRTRTPERIRSRNTSEKLDESVRLQHFLSRTGAKAPPKQCRNWSGLFDRSHEGGPARIQLPNQTFPGWQLANWYSEVASSPRRRRTGVGQQIRSGGQLRESASAFTHDGSISTCRETPSPRIYSALGSTPYDRSLRLWPVVSHARTSPPWSYNEQMSVMPKASSTRIHPLGDPPRKPMRCGCLDLRAADHTVARVLWVRFGTGQWQATTTRQKNLRRRIRVGLRFTLPVPPRALRRWTS